MYTNNVTKDKNSFGFNFQQKMLTDLNLELPFTEHIEEIKQRLLHLVLLVLLVAVISFVEVKPIVRFLQVPVQNVKFFQLSPSEYFFSTLQIAFYSGIILTSPFFLNQIILFISPGLTFKETRLIGPLLITSIFLFFLSLVFSYFVLVPAASGFFISYNQDVIEPLWSFNQYFNFILVLAYTTSLAFQIPIFQLVIGMLGIVSGKEMLNIWKYVILFATIIGAVLTPSTDPITQILLSGAIILLYLTGVGILLALNK